MGYLKKCKLKEFVTFVPGINQSRAATQLESKTIKFYDQDSFNQDYHYKEVNMDEDLFNTSKSDNLSLDKGSVVISNSLNLATLVGESNVNKVLSLNFTKVEFNKKELDKRYFLYLFNVSKEIQRQKERKLQGSGLVLRIPIKTLEDLDIPLIPLEEQKKIGQIYSEVLKLQGKLSRYSNLIEKMTHSILEESVKGVSRNEK